jgi:hypothetical protein
MINFLFLAMFGIVLFVVGCVTSITPLLYVGASFGCIGLLIGKLQTDYEKR